MGENYIVLGERSVKEKYICLRDDDTNFFTEPEELEYCYGEFWGKLPLTLAAIPFVHGSERRILQLPDQEHKYRALREWELSATAEELSEYHDIFPIGLNDKLVEELKKKIVAEKIEIAQHGVNHKYTEYGEEMLSKNMGLVAIRDGKEYLTKVFEQPIRVFVPPANTIDNICADHLKALNLELFCCGSMVFSKKRTKIVKAIMNPTGTIEAMTIRKQGYNKPVRNRGGYIITSSITYDAEKEKKDILDLVNKSLDKYGFASITSHYRLLSDKYEKGKKYDYRKNYHELLRELSEEGCVFLRASDYIKKAKEKLL